MIRKLLATTALTAFMAGGAFAQTAAEHELTVAPGDTIIIEAQREEAEVTIRFQAGAQQAQQEQVQPDDRQQFQQADMQSISADDMIGMNVYSARDENIGNIGDVLLTAEGEVDAIVVDVGGFLGMGAREVAMGMEDIDFVTDADGNLRAYTPYDQNQLEGAPQYDQAGWAEQRDEQRLTGEMAAQMQPAQQDQQAAAPGEAGQHVIADGGTLFVQSNEQNVQLSFEVRLAGGDAAQVGEAATDQQAEASPQDQQAAAPGATDTRQPDQAQQQPGIDQERTAAIDRQQLEAVDVQAIRADDLIGSNLYGAGDENIGNVGDLVMTEQGDIDAMIVDVGGFLGLGAREVALGFDEVEIMRDGNNWYVYTRYTREQLEAAPEYDATTYADQRDRQRVMQQ